MTYHPIDQNDDGVVGANIDNPETDSDRILANNELDLPEYDDVSNAPQKASGFVWATGNGTSAEGVYVNDGGSYTKVGGGSGALVDSGTDSDGGDDYQMPKAADNIDLQSDGAIQNADSISTEQADITNENNIDLAKSADTSLTAGQYTTIPFDDVISDDRSEWDTTNDELVVDKTGKYIIDMALNFDSGSDGDRRGIELRNVTDSNRVVGKERNRDTFESVIISTQAKLDSSKTYVIRARNNDSDDNVRPNEGKTYFKTRSLFREA